MERWLRYTILFVALALLQVLIFSHIHFAGMVNAFPYVYFIMILPFGANGRQILLLSALLGFAIDFMSGTMGVHMTAMVFAGYARILLLPALSPSGDYEVGATPCVRDNGWPWFLRYSVLMILIHHLILFFTESFTLMHFGTTLANALLSSIFSLLIIILFQVAVRKHLS
jgi:hypothetical protein